jgi:hypothetical protein
MTYEKCSNLARFNTLLHIQKKSGQVLQNHFFVLLEITLLTVV